MSDYISSFNIDGVNLPVRDEDAIHQDQNFLTIEDVINKIYPVGYELICNGDPNSFLGVGVWESVGNETYLKLSSVGENSGGSNEIILDISNIPEHTHTINNGGDHSHNVTMDASGTHTHKETIDESGNHTHNAQIKYDFNRVQSNTTNGISGVYDQGTQLSSNMIVVSESGSHTHNSSISEGGEHTHTAQCESAGEHNHTASKTGGGQPIKIEPKYYTMKLWKRVS